MDFSSFQSFRTVLCICPCCGEVHRLSDLNLQYDGKTPSTWLDKVESRASKLDDMEASFEEKEAELRKLAAERGRKRAMEMVRKSMMAGLASLKLNPYDIKTLISPVDFVVFDGMNEEKVEEVAFLRSSKATSMVRKAGDEVERLVKARKYEWKVARVDTDGNVKWE